MQSPLPVALSTAESEQQDENKQCLILKSSNFKNADQDIVAAIQGIRNAVRAANAEAMFVTPLYIVIPPSAVKMMDRITKKTTKVIKAGAPPLITSLQLSGTLLSEVEKVEWSQKRDKIYHEDLRRLKNHLVRC